MEDLVILGDAIEGVGELRQLAQRNHVQPNHVGDPLLGFRLHRIQIQRCTTLDECLKLLKTHLPHLHVYLHRQQQGVQELVLLVEPTHDEFPHIAVQEEQNVCIWVIKIWVHPYKGS